MRVKKTTVAPKGFGGARETFFSTIKSSESKRQEVYARKQAVEAVLKLQTTPQLVNIIDYTHGTEQTETVLVNNYSGKLQCFRIEAPTTEFFSIDKSTILKEITLASGMNWSFDIKFQSRKLMHLNIIHDYCKLVMRDDGSTIDIKLTATPISSCIQIPKNLNFGLLFTSKDLESADFHNEMTIGLENTGKKRALVNVIYDSKLPITVVPSEFFLGPCGQYSSHLDITVKISHKYMFPGPFIHQIHFEVYHLDDKVFSCNKDSRRWKH